MILIDDTNGENTLNLYAPSVPEVVSVPSATLNFTNTSSAANFDFSKTPPNFEQRMFVLVMRHLSGIAKGIQAAHAITEYALKYNLGDANWTPYRDWAKRDKTIILLDCNTTQAMEEAKAELEFWYVDCAMFREPDLNNSPTALAFILDERVFTEERLVSEDSVLNSYPFLIQKLRNFKKRFKLASN